MAAAIEPRPLITSASRSFQKRAELTKFPWNAVVFFRWNVPLLWLEQLNVGHVDLVNYVWRPVATLAGLSHDKRHPHVLKHSLASHLEAGDVHLALVRQCLGHRSISSTMKYVGFTDSQAAKAA